MCDEREIMLEKFMTKRNIKENEYELIVVLLLSMAAIFIFIFEK